MSGAPAEDSPRLGGNAAPESEPDVAVIIVNYRTADLTAAAVHSVLDDARVSQVIVVDNASNDGSAQRLRSALHDPRVRVIESPTNVGFGSGVNLGARHCDAHLLFLLNSDAVLRPGSLEALREALLADDSVAIVAPALYRAENGDLQEGAHGVFPTLTSLIKRTNSRPPETIWPDWVSGAAMLVRRSDFDAVGGFDADLSMYLEDVDLCRRMRARGRRVRRELSAAVVHMVAQSWVSREPSTQAQASRVVYAEKAGLALPDRLAMRLMSYVQLARIGLGAVELPRQTDIVTGRRDRPRSMTTMTPTTPGSHPSTLTDTAVPRSVPEPERVEDLYLDLLKRVLTRSEFPHSFRLIPAGRQLRHLPRRIAQRLLAARGLQLVMKPDTASRRDGRDWPSDAETMIGTVRLDNLQRCVTDVLVEGVPGDLIETGVWRGGASIFMRGVLKAHRVTDRLVWAADSFQGLPRPEATRFREDGTQVFWGYDALAVSLDDVKANFARYGLLDDQVRFVAGWFRDTLPSLPIGPIAVLRLDGDMYESTIIALEALYPKLSPGGYVIVDDYKAVPACMAAVNDYRSAHRIEEPMHEIDWGAVFWRRSTMPPPK